jgi:hypothetical protein
MSRDTQQEGGIVLGDLVNAKKRHIDLMTPNMEPPPTGGGAMVVLTRTPEQASFIAQQCKRLSTILSPPDDGRGNVPGLKDVVNRISVDGFGEHIDKETQQAKIVIFLYGRNYLSEEHHNDRRKVEVAVILDESTASFDRVTRIIQMDGDVRKPSCNAHTDLWKNISTNYGHDDPSGMNIFSSHGVRMVQRVQHYGSCFLQAPVVVQAYKVQASGTKNKEGRVEMVDLCKYVRHSFSSEALSAFLVVDKGGDSSAALQNILQTSAVAVFKGLETLEGMFEPGSDGDTNSCEIRELLTEHGAALVGKFRFDSKIKNYDVGNLHTGAFSLAYIAGPNLVDLKKEERHAMVLVGMRRINNEWSLLLQNWWSKMQFVEVSGKYFLSSDTALTFVLKDQHKIPGIFSRCDSLYAEANVEGCAFTSVRKVANTAFRFHSLTVPPAVVRNSRDIGASFLDQGKCPKRFNSSTRYRSESY